MHSDEQRFSPEYEPLANRLDKIRQCMRRAAEKSGRDVTSICLVGVTKTIRPTVINQILDLNVENIGENKVQEAQNKRPDISLNGRAVTHHLIGHYKQTKFVKHLNYLT